MQLDGRSQAGALGAACALLVLLGACAPSAPGGPSANPEAGVGPLVDEAERMRAGGDYAAAIQAYEQARERTPWNERLTTALAETYAERAAEEYADGKLVPAEADLRSSLELAPGHPEVSANLARVLLERARLDLDPAIAAQRRAEAELLAPGISAAEPVRDAGVERRLDLAFELLERGQLEVGIQRLEELHEAHPENAETSGLLAQALSRQAEQQAEHAAYQAAAESLDRAVALYLALPGCAAPEWSDCSQERARTAHHNRIVAWLNASSPENARRALQDARQVGLDFPELAAFLGL